MNRISNGATPSGGVKPAAIAFTAPDYKAELAKLINGRNIGSFKEEKALAELAAAPHFGRNEFAVCHILLSLGDESFFSLFRFGRDSELDKLWANVCAGPPLKDDAAEILSKWLKENTYHPPGASAGGPPPVFMPDLEWVNENLR